MRKSGLMLKAVLTFAVVALLMGVAEAETKFPERPITWIVQAAPGGGLDTTARLLANVAKEYAGQNIVVENVLGGGGAVGVSKLANSKADGYTIGLIYPTILCEKYLREDVKYDVDSFAYVCQVNSDPSMLITKAGSKYDVPLPKLVEMAKTEKITIGSSGTWLPHDYNRMFLMEEAGVKFVRIGYDGGGALTVAALAAGDIDVAYCFPSEWISYYQSKSLVGIAVSSPNRLAAFPDIPTIKESGFKYPDTSITRVVSTPVGVPQEVLDKLEDIFMKALKDPRLIEAYAKAGMVAMPLGQAEAKKVILDQTKAYTDFLKEHNVKPNTLPW